MTAHDHGYKRLFSHTAMIRDLLMGFVREPWIADLDFATLEKYPGEFIDDRLRNRHSDVIWRLRWGPNWLYIYVLLEFQSRIHPHMAVRLLSYLGLFYQDLLDTRQIAPGQRLPPVLPIVLYNGQRPWTAPTEIADLIEPGPVGLQPYHPRLRYLLIDESAYRDAELAVMRNLAAALFRLENSHDPQTVQAVLTALADWLASPEHTELRRAFVIWLQQIFLKHRLPGVELPQLNELEEMRAMLSERIVEWTEQWKQDGLQQGLQQGLHSERRMLLRLIRRRFGEAIAEQSNPALERIERPTVFEDLGEDLLDSADESAWLVRLNAAAEKTGH